MFSAFSMLRLHLLIAIAVTYGALFCCFVCPLFLPLFLLLMKCLLPAQSENKSHVEFGGMTSLTQGFDLTSLICPHFSTPQKHTRAHTRTLL